MQFAMLDHLEKPKSGFEDVIRVHFTLKRDEVLAQVEGWVSEAQKRGGSGLAHAEKLKVLLVKLAAKLAALPPI